MNKRKAIASIFLLTGVILGIIFYRNLEFPQGPEPYLQKSFYNQFGPMAIVVEMLFAGYYLMLGSSKANFALALFAFTAVLDAFFNFTGLFASGVPLYAMILFLGCAGVSLWVAFTNTFETGRISLIKALGSFILGNAVELFFNYL
ncbi:MAG: hypothetical protein R3252_11650 [Robiginitalea sp.]|nr:hypothetical protein [Robiginitalea sp.]